VEADMVSVIILAATLYICPGNVFSNEPKEGCKPFHESNKEGFSTVPEPKFETPPAGTAPPEAPSVPSPPRSQPQSSSNAELCALYAEYIQLTMKVTGGQLGSTPEDVNRYEQLRNLFGLNSRPPNCP
jgi:hypothetical protein